MDALTSEAILAVGQAGDGRLTPADYALIGAKSRANRLGFAVMLLFFRERGRFPRGPDEVDAGTVADLARRLDVPEPDPDALFPFGAAERTLERQRAEIRALFAFREATIADAEALGIWLRDYAVAETRDIGRLAAALEERCRAIAIEPPTADRIERIVRAAIHAHEERFAATIHACLSLEARERLDALLHPARAVEDGEDIAEPVAGARAVLNFVRGDPGRASVNSVKRGQARAGAARRDPRDGLAGRLVRRCAAA